MSKAPSPRADMLQEMRERRYGHLQAKATPVAAMPAPKPTPNVPGKSVRKPVAKKRRKAK